MDILADFFYRISLLFYFFIEGKINPLFLIAFTMIFLFFITGFTPFKFFKNDKLLYYTGKSVPFAVTMFLTLLLVEKFLPASALIFKIEKIFKQATYLLCAVALAVKFFCYSEKMWKITER